MSIRVRLEMGQLQHLQASAQPNADRIVETSARAIEGQAKINASGRPGPNVDTGNFRNSYTVQKLGQAKRRIGASADYGPFLEMGTSHAPAYPSLKPAFDQEAPKLKAALKGVVKWP